MIHNIIDRRSLPYRWRRVEAIIEATSHDNGAADSDVVAETDDDVTYDCRDGISVREAIEWADQQQSAVTLFLYDEGTNQV